MLAEGPCFQARTVLARSVCLMSQRLSHECPSTSFYKRNSEWLVKAVISSLIVIATWITVVILELVHAPKPNIAQELYLLDTMEGPLRELVRSSCEWVLDEGYHELGSLVYFQQRFLQTLVVGSPLLNEAFTRELWLGSVVLYL